MSSSETGTKKCDDAEAKGVKIVNEDWVRNRIENNGGGNEDDDEDEEEDGDEDEDDEEEEDESPKITGTPFARMVFALSGPLFALCFSYFQES